MIYLLISTVCWAFWSVCLSKASGIPSLWATIIAYVPGFIMAGIVALTTSNWQFMHANGVWWALAAGISGTVGSLTFLRASHHFSGHVVVSVTSIYPILSILIFACLGGTHITIKQIVGIIIMIMSMILLVIPGSMVK